MVPSVVLGGVTLDIRVRSSERWVVAVLEMARIQLISRLE